MCLQKRGESEAADPFCATALLAMESIGTPHLSVSAMTTSEGSCGLVHEASCHILVCGGTTGHVLFGPSGAISHAIARPIPQNRRSSPPLGAPARPNHCRPCLSPGPPLPRRRQRNFHSARS